MGIFESLEKGSWTRRAILGAFVAGAAYAVPMISSKYGSIKPALNAANYLLNGTGKKEDEKVNKDEEDEPKTVEDAYESIKDKLKETPFILKDGKLLVNAEEGRSWEDYLKGLGVHSNISADHALYSDAKKRGDELYEVSFKAFVKTNIYGDIAVYTPPYLDAEDLDLSRFGIDDKRVRAFIVKPAKVPSGTLSPDDTYRKIKHSFDGGDEYFFAEELVPERRTCSITAPANKYTKPKSEIWGESSRVFILPEHGIANAYIDSIFGKIRSQAGESSGGNVGATPEVKRTPGTSKRGRGGV